MFSGGVRVCPRLACCLGEGEFSGCLKPGCILFIHFYSFSKWIENRIMAREMANNFESTQKGKAITLN